MKSIFNRHQKMSSHQKVMGNVLK